MHLTQLQCEHFRGLEALCFQPVPGTNVIRGENAQGKTSLLEALLFLTTSKSHRTTAESDLVRHGGDDFHIRGRVVRADRAVEMEAHWWKGNKRFKVNGLALQRVSDVLGKVNVVFFSPEDTALVQGAAAQRRRFLDMALSQLSPEYLHALQQYRQVLRQRNELLRNSNLDPAHLDAWDEQLAEQGETLMRERSTFLEQLAAHAADAYREIAAMEKLELAYRPDVKTVAPLLKALQAARRADLKQGVTTRGPHRDDFEFLIEGVAARNFGSQGQQKTAALTVKLAELRLARERTGEYPVLMLDDVVSELDASRSRRLFEALTRDIQCLVTTTDLTPQNGLFGRDCAEFLIKGGRLEEA